MTDENLELLDKEIKSQIEKLGTLEPGTEDHAKVVDSLVKLQKLDNENYKARTDADNKYYDREFSKETKSKELELKEKELEFKTAEFEQTKKSRNKELTLKEKELELKGAELELKSRQLDDEVLNRNNENIMKAQQMKDERIGTYIRAGVEVGGLLVPAFVYMVLFHKGLKFEETGTVASSMVRNLMGKFKPTKR